jgi:hypothetical protein
MTSTTYKTDTTPEVHAVQLECLRRMLCAEHFAMMCRMTANVRTMAFDANRRRHPDFNDQQVRLRVIELTYGKKLAERVAQDLKERQVV